MYIIQLSTSVYAKNRLDVNLRKKMKLPFLFVLKNMIVWTGFSLYSANIETCTRTIFTTPSKYEASNNFCEQYWRWSLCCLQISFIVNDYITSNLSYIFSPCHSIVPIQGSWCKTCGVFCYSSVPRTPDPLNSDRTDRKVNQILVPDRLTDSSKWVELPRCCLVPTP